MRIDLTSTALSGSDYASGVRRQPSPSGEAAPSGAGEDYAQLSAESQVFSDLRSQLNAAPELRMDRVAALRQSVEEGTYQVSPTRIADAMLRDASGIALRTVGELNERLSS